MAISKFQAAVRATAFAAFCIVPLVAVPGNAAAQDTIQDDADEEIVFHKLALQVSDDDQTAMRSALDIASNVSRSYSAKAHEVEIRIVVYGPGLDMLRPDRSPVLDRLKAFEQSMPNVTFAACRNTLDTLERKEGRRPELVPYAEVVEAGGAELIELHERGYTIIKP
jgi:intracellular sulfur oxidation DsrE/DsrF family protein